MKRELALVAMVAACSPASSYKTVALTPAPPDEVAVVPLGMTPTAGPPADLEAVEAELRKRKEAVTALKKDKAAKSLLNTGACRSGQYDAALSLLDQGASDEELRNALEELNACAQQLEKQDLGGKVTQELLINAVVLEAPIPDRGPPSVGSQTSGLSYQSVAIAAIGDFVVSRAKAELLEWVASDVAAKLCKQQEGDVEVVSTYFPQSCTLLKGADDSVNGELRQFGRTLQAGLQEDVFDLLPRLVNKAPSAWAGVARRAYQLIDGIHRGQDPLVLARAAMLSLACTSTDSTPSNSASCVLKLTAHVIGAVVATPNWTTADLSNIAEVSAVLNDINGKLTAAVIADQELDRWLKGNFGTWDRQDLAQAVFTSSRQIHAILVKARVETDREKRKRLFEDLLATTIELVLSSDAAVSNHAQENISQALGTVHQILRSLHQAWAAFDARDMGLFVASLTNAATHVGAEVPVPKRLRPLLPFIAAFAGAKDADDMKRALEKYAAPTGGYKEKRARSMGSLSAFVGGAAGGEQFVTPTENSFRGHVGLFAPIGIDVSCGGKHWCAGLGAMVSVIDVGNVISLGFGDSTRAPSPRLRQVLSPGIYLRWHPEALGPLALGFGGAVVPEMGLAAEDDDSFSPGFKLVGFIAADVTILPF